MTDAPPAPGTATPYAALVGEFADAVSTRLDALAAMAADGGLDAAIDLLTATVQAGGVLHAFGTGHSEAFAMEIAGRAGGLIPTSKIALRDLVLRGDLGPEVLGGSTLERDPAVAEQLWAVSPVQPGDVLLIASSSGVNGSVVGLALLARQHGIPVVAVTSLAHTRQVQPKHASGRRLSEVADIVIDNLAPYGDAVLDPVDGVPVGAVSSLTAAFIAQLLTVGVAQRIAAAGDVPPLYLSANIPGGDEHNHVLEARYEGRIHRGG